jgi:hypothetical protein
MISAGLIFRAFGLNEDRIGPPLQYLDHRQHVRLDDVLERGDEAPVSGQLLVPPAIFRREDRADEHLVDGRIELHPGETFGERACISREELWKIWVLEIADPVGHAEMAEVGDRHDVAALEVREGDVGELPVIAAGRQIGAVNRRAVAQIVESHFVDEIEILPPALIMEAGVHLVDADAAVVDGRDAVLDPGGEHEVGDRILPRCALCRG